MLLEVHRPLEIHHSRKWNNTQYCLLVFASYQYLHKFNTRCEVLKVVKSVHLQVITGCDHGAMENIMLVQVLNTTCLFVSNIYLYFKIELEKVSCYMKFLISIVI